MKQENKKETKEVVVQEQHTPAVGTLSDTMKDIGVTAGDLVIPKLLLMQNTSEYVGDDKAKLGDVLNSQSLEILGGFATPIDIIPLKLYKTWRVYDMTSGQPEFMRQDAVTAQNEKLPWDDQEDGKPIRRDLCMNFFALLKKDVEASEAFPVVVSFKRTSMQAGRQLATHLFKMACLGRVPYSQVLPLKVSKQKKETNTYGVFEIGKGVELSADHKQVAKDWLERLATMIYKIDDADTEGAPETAPAPAPVVVGSGPAMKF